MGKDDFWMEDSGRLRLGKVMLDAGFWKLETGKDGGSGSVSVWAIFNLITGSKMPRGKEFIIILKGHV